ncbi:MAG: hypothetical protein MK179_15670 [Pirellulaceae bacterium]|nr:hypothetical protein [Pirellulaceae bacterium]
MRVLVGEKWQDDYLDQFLARDSVRIQVLAWKNLQAIRDQYIVREKSLIKIWNYVREVGVWQIYLKIRSRLRESLRNEKFISCGVGIVQAAGEDVSLQPGQHVVFLAGNHPRCMERIVLPASLVQNCETIPQYTSEGLCYYPTSNHSESSSWWSPLYGWSAFSGTSYEIATCAEVLQQAEASLRHSQETPQRLPLVPSTPPLEKRTSKVRPSSTQHKSAILFGYGHYAKSIILPHIKHHLNLVKAHEVDPTQIPGPQDAPPIQFDTSPLPRDGEQYDVYLIAGYHHTHGPLAAHALRQGAWAVVEKPLVTTWQHLEELTEVLRDGPGKGLYGCFHKRYHPFNDLAKQDLGVSPGQPISYHCIVFEEPLPEHHWYRWPNSGSRLTSNGCHWLDHFLYLNDFSRPTRLEVFESTDETLNISVELENSAFFTMTLTDQGTRRIGVQDYIELRANQVTVKMVNSSTYLAENDQRILRRRKYPKIKNYNLMYRRIASQIEQDDKGDSLDSVLTSCRLILELEDELQRQRK